MSSQPPIVTLVKFAFMYMEIDGGTYDGTATDYFRSKDLISRGRRTALKVKASRYQGLLGWLAHAGAPRRAVQHRHHRPAAELPELNRADNPGLGPALAGKLLALAELAWLWQRAKGGFAGELYASRHGTLWPVLT